MPTRYTVQQGDCLSRIAHAHGFRWQDIWEHPDNAELRSLRRSPDVLYPGDVVSVPDKEVAAIGKATKQSHRFERKGVPVEVHLRLLLEHVELKPRAGAAYTYDIDGGERGAGQTDDDGRIVLRVQPDAKVVNLVLSGGTEAYELHLGHLDPVETTTGLQGRLLSLDYYTGPCGGRFDEGTWAALTAFEAANAPKADAGGTVVERIRRFFDAYAPRAEPERIARYGLSDATHDNLGSKHGS